VPTTQSLPHAAARPPDPASRPTSDRFAGALAKTIHRFRAYPPDSPLCAEALDACHQALGACGGETLTLKIAPRGLLINDEVVSDTPAVVDMHRRLHDLGVGTIGVLAETSARDLACFCRELIAREGKAIPESLPESLAARGVSHLHVAMVVRPAVLGAETIPAERLARLDVDERQRTMDRGDRGGNHLYPPDKGWVRLDPGLPLPAQMSLTGLAQLVGDPLALATMLVSLSDQPPFDDPADALADKFATVCDLFRSIEPSLSTALFGRLARSVLEFSPEQRMRLMRDTILPGLIEGRLDGSMPRHLPDAVLAESLAQILDEGIAGRELTLVALERIDLPPDRRTRVESLLAQSASTARHSPTGVARGAVDPGHVDGYESGHITVDLTTPKEFNDFAQFDLAIDKEAEAALAAARASIETTRPPIERLRCLVNLLSLEASPDTARRLVNAAAPLLAQLRADGNKHLIAEWIQRLREAASRARQARPEVASLIDGVLSQQVDERLLGELLGLGGDPGGRGGPVEMLEAFGAAAAPALVDLLEHEGVRSRRHALVKMMSACAPAIAPGLLPFFPHPQKFVTRNLATVLGHAGQGYETALLSVVGHPDVRVGREALRALAQIGSPAALDAVVRAFDERQEVALIAEEVFWSFAEARQAAIALLGDAAFAADHPALARRLLERAAHSDTADLAAAAAVLRGFRLHVWRPAHVRLGLAASKVGRR
jgi:hypothetical protein